jgi:hypothetical protein
MGVGRGATACAGKGAEVFASATGATREKESKGRILRLMAIPGDVGVVARLIQNGPYCIKAPI